MFLQNEPDGSLHQIGSGQRTVLRRKFTGSGRTKPHKHEREKARRLRQWAKLAAKSAKAAAE